VIDGVHPRRNGGPRGVEQRTRACSASATLWSPSFKKAGVDGKTMMQRDAAGGSVEDSPQDEGCPPVSLPASPKRNVRLRRKWGTKGVEQRTRACPASATPWSPSFKKVGVDGKTMMQRDAAGGSGVSPSISSCFPQEWGTKGVDSIPSNRRSKQWTET
jgi:hypothetical protein